MNEFLDDLYGEHEGYVYAPVKQGPAWIQHFFKWPQEREALETHIGEYNDRDVYISPVLFTEQRIAPETFKGTQYLWTEFDGTIPQGEVLEPSMRILSSNQGHEHWYWRLDAFISDKVLVEDLTKRLAYHYGADLSVWDYQNVLRPPDTWNHKRNRPVTLLHKTDNTYPIDHFLWVPIPPTGSSVSVSVSSLPRLEVILAKHQWREDTINLLYKTEVKEGTRSDALARLAYDAVETGCSNEEVFVLLEFLDSSLGKFVGRTDRHRRLEEIISHVRTRKLTASELDANKAPAVYGLLDFMNTDIKLQWAIAGLLPVAGSLVILGTEGIGKSTLLLRLAESVGLGQNKFLVWDIVKRQRVLFVSLEMQHEELKQFLEDMQFSNEELQELQEWFHIWPVGHAYPFDTPDQQLELTKYIDMYKIDLVIIDSLGTSTYGSIKDDDTIKRLNAFLNEEVRKKRKCGYVFIHHLRKKGIGEIDKETDLDESFGSKYITTNAQSILLFSEKRGGAKLQLKLLKSRMTIGQKSFEITRTANRGFELVDQSNPTDNGSPPSQQAGDVRPLGGLLDL